MRKRIWQFGVLVASLVLFSPLAQPKSAFDADLQQWTLSSDRLTAVFQLTSEGNFTLERLSDTLTGDQWRRAQDRMTAPFEIQAGGDAYDSSTSFHLIDQSSQAIVKRGYRQTIRLQDSQNRALITVVLEVYDGQPVLRYQVRFRNLQGAAVKVRQANFLPWSFDGGGGDYRVFRVKQWAWNPVPVNFESFESIVNPTQPMEDMLTGAYGQYCTWLTMRDGNDRGLFAGWEFDGRATARVDSVPGAGVVRMSGSISDLDHRLAPNQEFPLPAAFLGLYHGDWDEAGYRTQRFVEAVIAKAVPESSFPYVIWDSWHYGTAINEATLRRNAEIAARLGVEAFVLDLGWARQIGEWREDPKKFPSGLRALSDYVHSLGMKFGLHWPLAEANLDSPVLSEHPDWTSSVSYGYFGAVSLCLAHRPVRDWLVAEAVRMIDEYNVDWILQDGENMVKQCTKTTHTHTPDDSNFAGSAEGLNLVTAAVQKQRPKVLWENCEDGGNMMTYSMTRRYVTSIAADNSGPLTTRQAIHGATYPFSPRYVDRYMQDEGLTPYITRSNMFGGPWIFMVRLPELSAASLEFAAAEVKLYKSLRGRIRNGKVFHLSERPADGRNDAIESYTPSSDSAIVMVYRTGTAANPVIKPRGFTGDKSYRVRFQDDRRTLTMTGAQLESVGIPMNLAGPWTAEIVYIDPLPR